MLKVKIRNKIIIILILKVKKVEIWRIADLNLFIKSNGLVGENVGCFDSERYCESLPNFRFLLIMTVKIT